MNERYDEIKKLVNNSRMLIEQLNAEKLGPYNVAKSIEDKIDDDEEEYTKQLFRRTLALGSDSEKMIADNAPNWEADRIATMDMVILKMALAEAQTFESIPLKVTMNEYIELANYYSTPKSNVFINGLLETLFAKLQADGKIKKIGRGLIDA